MIEKQIASTFQGDYVKIRRRDGQIWYGKLIQVTESSLVLNNKKHGKSAISLEDIEDISQTRGENNDSYR